MLMSSYVSRGSVRARDLRSNIKELGFEQGVVATLEAMLEEHVQDRLNLREMAEMLDRCTDILTTMTQVGDEIRKQLIEMKRINDQEDSIDHGNS